MKYALVTVLILVAIVWVDLQVPLTGLTPTVRTVDRAIDDLVADLARGDPDAAGERLAAIRRGWRRIEVGMSLLADKPSRRRFEELVERIRAGLAAGEEGALAADAAELREVWYEILSP